MFFHYATHMQAFIVIIAIISPLTPLSANSIQCRWANGFQAHVNTLPRFDPAVSTAAGGDPNIAYYHSFWRLGADQALVVEVGAK